MTVSPVALFTYNRPAHTRKVVEALQRNSLSALTDLFIYSDGPKSGVSETAVREVRDYLHNIQGFKTVRIIERQTNVGLAANIIEGVNEILKQFETVIVLEDDLLSSRFFLDYMNEGLLLYKDEEKVISIHGYVYPVDEHLPESFFLRGADCWGWATWRRGWSLFEPDGTKLLKRLIKEGKTTEFDFEDSYPYTQMLEDQIAGKTNSWAVRWYASAFLADKYTLYPGKSLISNIGGDGSGTNNGYTYSVSAELSDQAPALKKTEVQQNNSAFRAFAKFHRKSQHPNLWKKIKRKLKIVLKP